MSKVTPIPEKPDMSHISEDRKKKWTQWVRRAYNHTGYIYTPCDGRAYLHHPGDGTTIKEAGELWASFVSEDGKPQPTAWHQYRSYGSPTEFRDFDEDMSALEMWSEWVTRRAETSIPYFEYGLVYNSREINTEEAGRRWCNFTKEGIPGDDVYSLGEKERGSCEYHLDDFIHSIYRDYDLKSFKSYLYSCIKGSFYQDGTGRRYKQPVTIALPAFDEDDSFGMMRTMIISDTWAFTHERGESPKGYINRKINNLNRTISTLNPEIARCEFVQHSGDSSKIPEGLFWKGEIEEEGVWMPSGMKDAIEDSSETSEGRWLLIHLNGGSFEYK